MQYVLNGGNPDADRVSFNNEMRKENKQDSKLAHSINIIRRFVLNRNISINMNREGATIVLYDFDVEHRAHPRAPEVYRDYPVKGTADADLLTFCARILELCEEWQTETVHVISKDFLDC